jgi:hypothetical protein
MTTPPNPPITPNPTPKKSVVWPLLLAVGFSLPQALTFSEALREATSYDSDWVLMSAGLFTAAGVCVLIAGYRLLGWIGVGVGLAILGGVGGFAYVKLDASMRARIEIFERNQALRDAYPLMYQTCKDQQPYAAAAAYDPQRSGTHPTVVFEIPQQLVGSTYAPPDPRDPIMIAPFGDWRPKTADQAELIACYARTERKVESCQYTGGVLHRVQYVAELKVYALSTGELVFEDSREGSPPPECQMMEEFYGDSTVTSRGGDFARIEDFAEVLRPLAIVP